MSSQSSHWTTAAASLVALLGLSNCIIRTQPVNYSASGQAQVSSGPATVEPPPPGPPAEAETTTIQPPPPGSGMTTIQPPPPATATTTIQPPPPATATTTIQPPPSAPSTTAPSPTSSMVLCSIEIGPIWNQADAQNRCPSSCSSLNSTWNGQWWTTRRNAMSVCQCSFSPGTVCAPVDDRPAR